MTPSDDLITNFRRELERFEPFSAMSRQDIDWFLTHSQQLYFEPDEVVFSPESGVVNHVLFIRRGCVSSSRVNGNDTSHAFEFQEGDLFPTNAFLANRAVTQTYVARADTFALAIDRAHFEPLIQRNLALSGFLERRVHRFLELSRQALVSAHASRALSEQSLERPVLSLIRKSPVSCLPSLPLGDALRLMHEKQLGCMVVTDAECVPTGILTRYDLLERVILASADLNSPIGDVMVRPVTTMPDDRSALEATLLMSRHGFRHLPLTQKGILSGVVSERDLFALQKLNLKTVSGRMRVANDVEALTSSAAAIRELAHTLLNQGVQAHQLTAMISHLNDLLTERLLTLKSQEFGIDLSRLCWLALGSEGRGEQTIATDQDNALIIQNDCPAHEREAIRSFARSVNLALDECGFPLCKGGIMASEDACLKSLDEWAHCFTQWITAGTPEDLLNASIFFDFRALAGNVQWADELRSRVTQRAATTPRFLKMLADNAQSRTPALNWLGGLSLDERSGVDLKLRGTAIYVEAARIFSLMSGGTAISTRDRLLQLASHLQLNAREVEGWVTGFDFLQMLRLRIQLAEDANGHSPNWIAPDTLSDIDQRILKESMRGARSLLQLLALQFGG